jgi:hypothetical protein
MRVFFVRVFVGAIVLSLAACAAVACGGTTKGSPFGAGSSGANGSSGGSGGGIGSGSGSGNMFPGGSGGPSSSGGIGYDGGVPCPTGLECNVSCSGGGTTTISGKVYDPAGNNPIYNVVVYVPATPLQPLPKGVPTGNDSCSCLALFQSGAIVSTATAVDGTFTLTNAPTGSSVPLVIQIGKWRHEVNINVTACQDNPQPDKSLLLPATVAAGTNDSMPDIAVSTGSADTLECLMTRIGLPASEYVAGAGGSGHVHVFSGGDPNGTSAMGTPESPAMPNAPESDTTLWDTAAHLMAYDITLLSCEGAETYKANPPALEQYLNQGGRVFASHYHYAWFAGPMEAVQANMLTGANYSAPADWGTHLADWNPDLMFMSSPMPGMGYPLGDIGGIIDTTLNGSSMPFPKGVALQKWLGVVNALGQSGVPPTELSIFQPRFDVTVGPTNTPSQPWITSDSQGISGMTQYFSFDTPVNLTPMTGPDPGAPTYCGRAVYSDLHVSGDPMTTDDPNTPPPAHCANVVLSPQEKALEFMLFDLSSCVIPDTIAPPDSGIPIVQ